MQTGYTNRMSQTKNPGAMPSYQKARLQTVAYKQVREVVNNTLKNFKINTTQWMILGLLKDASEDQKISVIAGQLQVEVPLITTLAQPLMAIGYIEQHADKTDKRSKPLMLTEAGSNIIEQIELKLVKELRPLEIGLTQPQITQYFDTLQVLIANGEKAGV